MPPRRDAEYMDVDSGSDISLPDDDYDGSRAKGKGRSKTGERKSEKGKGKAKDNVSRVIPTSNSRTCHETAGIYMGSIICTVMGHCTRR